MTIPADSLLRSHRGDEAPTPDSPFLAEWLASGRMPNQLPISGVCNAECVFCSNHNNPFCIVHGLLRDLEDIKLQLSLMPPHDNPIRLSDSLPGRISEGEAFVHPRFFDILGLVRQKYLFNTLCFTTNGSMLDDAFLMRLAAVRPVEINVSLHSTQPALWARIFKRSEKAARTAIASLELIAKHGIALEGTIVPMPALCGWEDLELTYAALAHAGAKKVTLYAPGYTVSTPAEVVKDLACPMDELAAFAERMQSRHGVPANLLPDLARDLKLSVRRIMAATTHGNRKNGWGPFREVLWLASEAAHERLRGRIDQHRELFPNVQRVVPVENLTYGGNIVVAGLLMVEDFIEAGRAALARWPGTELVLVPGSPFDALNRDLRKRPAHAIQDALGKPVWVVREGARTEPLVGRIFSPAVNPAPVEVKRVLGWLDEVWRVEDGGDGGLDVVASYPIDTSEGPLDRGQLRAALLAHKARASARGKPMAQRFDVLDDTQALCIETWPTPDPLLTFHRWTFFVKVYSEWRVGKILWGKEEAYVAGEG